MSVFSFMVVLLNFLKYLRSVLFPKIVVSALFGLGKQFLNLKMQLRSIEKLSVDKSFFALYVLLSMKTMFPCFYTNYLFPKHSK